MKNVVMLVGIIDWREDPGTGVVNDADGRALAGADRMKRQTSLLIRDEWFTMANYVRL